MTRSILSIIVLLMISTYGNAQHKSPSEQFLSNTSLIQKQADFDAWKNAQDLDKTKGWKWYSRWLEEQSRMADGQGEIADQTPLFDAAIKMSKMKSSISFRNTSANWSPVGPSTKVKNLRNSIIIGVGRMNTIEFHPTDPSTFWVGVAQGGVWKTTNSGQSWTPLTDNLPILRISDIEVDPNNTDVMYISVGDYAYFGVGLKEDNRKRHTHFGLGVYKTIDGGITWNPTGLNYKLTGKDRSLIRRVFVDRTNSNNLVAAGIDGIWTSQDAGDHWNKVHNGQISDLERHPTINNTIFASTSNRLTINRGTAGLWKSTDFGATWTELNSGIPTDGEVQRIELTISISDPNYIYALAANRFGGFYGLYQSKDGGTSWKLQSNSPNIMHWDDGLRAQSGQGYYDLTIIVSPNDPELIYTGGVNVWGSKNGGKSWLPASYWRSNYGPSTHADQHFLAYNSLDQSYYMCNDGGVYRTKEIILNKTWAEIEDDRDFKWPTKWENLNTGIQATSFYRLSVSRQNDDVIGGAQDNSTYFRRDGQWYNVIGGDGMECIIDPNDPTIIYGSSQYGRLNRSTDRGESFGNLLRRFPTNEPGAWTTPFFVSPHNSDLIYVGLGNIWSTSDAGSTWDQLSDFRLIDALGTPGMISHFNVAKSDHDKIYVGKRIQFRYDEPSRFLSTVDGGNTWNDYTDGLPDSLYFNYIISDDNAPLKVWLSVGGFVEGQKVFYSEDAGENWKNISFNMPNIPVNCLAKDPNSKLNTLYAGTDIGVYYLNDDTEEWMLFSDQLPNVIVSELEIHSGKNKVFASTFGRGIWVSDLLDETQVSVTNIAHNDLNIRIAPSVNNGQFEAHITIPNSLQKKAFIQMDIIDIMGSKVHSNTVKNKGDFIQKYDLELLSGQYYLKVSIGNKTKAIPFNISQ